MGKDVLQLVETLELHDNVIFRDYVDRRGPPCSVYGGRSLCLPITLRGFGLPVPEAMSCGTPVLVSKSGALPEVIAEAGLAVNTEDPRTLADAIIRVMENAELRLHMREAGLRHSGTPFLGPQRRPATTSAGADRRSETMNAHLFYDHDYFEGRTRQSPRIRVHSSIRSPYERRGSCAVRQNRRESWMLVVQKAIS